MATSYLELENIFKYFLATSVYPYALDVGLISPKFNGMKAYNF